MIARHAMNMQSEAKKDAMGMSNLTFSKRHILFDASIPSNLQDYDLFKVKGLAVGEKMTT